MFLTLILKWFGMMPICFYTQLEKSKSPFIKAQQNNDLLSSSIILTTLINILYNITVAESNKRTILKVAVQF